jgi:hypothetical protein
VRERWTTLLCALGALAVFVTLFVHGPPADAPRAAPPTTLERGASGLYAAHAWLRAEGIRTLSLRERLDTLPRRSDLPTRGNLLIVLLPALAPYKSSETRALDRWLRAGNTLLLLAALSDEPDWAHAGDARADVTLLTGLELVLAKKQPYPDWPQAKAAQDRARADNASLLRFAQPLRSTLIGNRPHPFLAGVGSAVAFSDFETSTWDVRLPRAGFALALAHQRELGEDVLWLRPAGEGNIILSGFGSLFCNRLIGEADNARLLANIIAQTLGAGGAVLFDDAHQGLVDAYDPAKFYRDPRLYATLGVLLGGWFVWVLGGTRLRAPARRTPAPREADLVRTTGLFLARVLRPAAAARRMFEHFFRRLQQRTHSTFAEAPWEWLENHPRLAAGDVQQLREWYADAYSERRVPLLRLHNLIIRTERQLTA